MKKLFFLLLLPIIFISCENIDYNDDSYIKNNSNTEAVSKYLVSYTVDKDGNPYTMNYKLSREMLYNFN